jgi:hypothetical protein
MTVSWSAPKNRHAVFHAVCEAVNYHYERNPHDPRVIHTVALEVDAFGKVLKSADVGYGRRLPDPTLDARAQAKQSALTITYTENVFTNSIQAADDYRAPLACEARTYELTGLRPGEQTPLSFDELQAREPTQQRSRTRSNRRRAYCKRD